MVAKPVSTISITFGIRRPAFWHKPWSDFGSRVMFCGSGDSVLRLMPLRPEETNVSNRIWS